MRKYPKNKRDDIQILRGIAVLAVIFFHIRPLQFPNGFLGVDVFFVISGFVLAPKLNSIVEPHQTLKISFIKLRHFWINRALRLTPSLLFMLLVTTPFMFLVGPIEDHHKFSLQAIAAILFLGNFGAPLFSGDYFSPNPNPLIHLWSLSSEEQIYFIFPVVLILAMLRRPQSKNMVIKVIGVFSFLSFMLYLNLPEYFLTLFFDNNFHSLSGMNYYSPFSRLWQFALGYLVHSFGQSTYPGIKNRTASNWLAFTFLIFLLIFPTTIGIGYASFSAVLMTSLIIKLRSLEIISPPFRKLLVAIGDRSFAIYLFHLPFIFLAKHSSIFGDNSQSKKFPLLISILLTVFFSELNYRYIEGPRFANYSNELLRARTFQKIKIQSFVVLLLMIVMSVGSKNNYWGLDKSIKIPPVAWDINDGCKRMSVSSRPCFYGQSNRRIVLLIGDSHAAQISQSLIDAGAEEDWNVAIWTLATCQFNLFETTNKDETCRKQNIQILNWIHTVEPDLVFISEYVRNDTNIHDLFKSIDQINEKTHKIVFVKNIPIFPDENRFMKKETILKQLFGLAYRPPKTFPLSDMVSSEKQASDNLALLLSHSGASSVEFSNYFCDLKECNRFMDGKWLYWDNHHLSIYGAKLILPALRSVLRSS